MKNLKIIIAILLMSFVGVKAQIKKPSIKTNPTVFKGIKPAVNKGLRVANIVNLSPNKLKSLKIPKYNISLAKLNARAVRTWKINPLKQYDGNLQLENFYGNWRRGGWISTPLRNDFSNLEESRRSSNADFQINNYLSLFPLSLKFAVTKGTEYRLKVKFGAHGINKANSVYIVINSFVSKVDLNAQGEINYIFSLGTSRPIDIHISSYTENLTRDPFHGGYQRTIYKEIKIDRIDN
jgi:hypothetical protein